MILKSKRREEETARASEQGKNAGRWYAVTWNTRSSQLAALALVLVAGAVAILLWRTGERRKLYPLDYRPEAPLDIVEDEIEGASLKLPAGIGEQPPADELFLRIESDSLSFQTIESSIVDKQRAFSFDTSKVASLDRWKVPAKLKRGGSGYILPLYDALVERADLDRKIAEYNPSRPFEGNLGIIADRNMPLRTLQEILYTAGQAEFGKFQLVLKNASAPPAYFYLETRAPSIGTFDRKPAIRVALVVVDGGLSVQLEDIDELANGFRGKAQGARVTKVKDTDAPKRDHELLQIPVDRAGNGYDWHALKKALAVAKTHLPPAKPQTKQQDERKKKLLEKLRKKLLPLNMPLGTANEEPYPRDALYVFTPTKMTYGEMGRILADCRTDDAGRLLFKSFFWVFSF